MHNDGNLNFKSIVQRSPIVQQPPAQDELRNIQGISKAKDFVSLNGSTDDTTTIMHDVGRPTLSTNLLSLRIRRSTRPMSPDDGAVTIETMQAKIKKRSDLDKRDEHGMTPPA